MQQQCSEVKQCQLWDLFLWSRVSAEVSVCSHFSQTLTLCECWQSESVWDYNQSLSVIWTYIIQSISALSWVYCCINMLKIMHYVRYSVTVVVSSDYLQMSSHCLKSAEYHIQSLHYSHCSDYSYLCHSCCLHLTLLCCWSCCWSQCCDWQFSLQLSKLTVRLCLIMHYRLNRLT